MELGPGERLLGVPHPLVAFTPCQRAATGDLASAEHGKNGGREGELHLTIYKDFVFIQLQIRSGGFGPDTEPKGRKERLGSIAGYPRRELHLYRLDAGSNSAHRPVANKLR